MGPGSPGYRLVTETKQARREWDETLTTLKNKTPVSPELHIWQSSSLGMREKERHSQTD